MFTYPGMLLLHSELGEHISEHTNFAEFISAGSLWEAYFSSFLTPEFCFYWDIMRPFVSLILEIPEFNS